MEFWMSLPMSKPWSLKRKAMNLLNEIHKVHIRRENVALPLAELSSWIILTIRLWQAQYLTIDKVFVYGYYLGNNVNPKIWIVYNWPIQCTVSHNYRNLLIDVIVNQ